MFQFAHNRSVVIIGPLVVTVLPWEQQI